MKKEKKSKETNNDDNITEGFNIITLGESGVGKTSIINRCL